jgi:hypothetical protein
VSRFIGASSDDFGMALGHPLNLAVDKRLRGISGAEFQPAADGPGPAIGQRGGFAAGGGP